MDDTTAGAPAEKPPAPEGMRYLDDAVGGGLAPIGPLGGPEPKTREELLAEQELKTEASSAAEREAIDKAKTEIKVDTAKESRETAPAA